MRTNRNITMKDSFVTFCINIIILVHLLHQIPKPHCREIVKTAGVDGDVAKLVATESTWLPW